MKGKGKGYRKGLKETSPCRGGKRKESSGPRIKFNITKDNLSCFIDANVKKKINKSRTSCSRRKNKVFSCTEKVTLSENAKKIQSTNE